MQCKALNVIMFFQLTAADGRSWTPSSNRLHPPSRCLGGTYTSRGPHVDTTPSPARTFRTPHQYAMARGDTTEDFKCAHILRNLWGSRTHSRVGKISGRSRVGEVRRFEPIGQTGDDPNRHVRALIGPTERANPAFRAMEYRNARLFSSSRELPQSWKHAPRHKTLDTRVLFALFHKHIFRTVAGTTQYPKRRRRQCNIRGPRCLPTPVLHLPHAQLSTPPCWCYPRPRPCTTPSRPRPAAVSMTHITTHGHVDPSPLRPASRYDTSLT